MVQGKPIKQIENRYEAVGNTQIIGQPFIY